MHDSTSKPALGAWHRLKQCTLSVASIREVDRVAVERFHMHSLVLMENAALGCVQWLTHRFTTPTRAVILCGRGNNGGDGLAIARHLRLANWSCEVLLIGPIAKLSPDALCNWQILNARGSDYCTLLDESWSSQQCAGLAEQLNRADVIIDAMLGSGATGTPRAPMSDLIRLANAASAARIAIDIPTGLDATTGQPAATTFQAEATLTFVARKPGFDVPAAQSYLGHVEVLPIGIPVELIEDLLK